MKTINDLILATDEIVNHIMDFSLHENALSIASQILSDTAYDTYALKLRQIKHYIHLAAFVSYNSVFLCQEYANLAKDEAKQLKHFVNTLVIP